MLELKLTHASAGKSYVKFFLLKTSTQPQQSL